MFDAMQEAREAVRTATMRESSELDAIALAIKALKFYADSGDYVAPFTGGLGKLYFDCGEEAKKAIALLEQRRRG
jgi:hypothetical protein